MSQRTLRDLFDKMDRDGSGTIDVHEYRKALRGYATNETVRAKILTMDTDLDGRVSFQEFARFMSAALEDDAPEDTPLFRTADGSPDWFALFVHFDRDGSGVLSLQELRALLDEIGHETDRGELIVLINALDTNGDMAISYSEFVAYFRGSAPHKTLNVRV